MKTGYTLTLFLITVSLLFSSCASTLPSESKSEPNNRTEDAFAELRESSESWIKYGLKAYEEKKEIQDVSEFLQKPTDVALLTLYETIFETDKERAILVAESFFSYITENHGTKAVLDLEKRVDYKNEFLKQIGSRIQYSQPVECEILLSKMKINKSPEYHYTVLLGPCLYSFRDLEPNGSISPTHAFLYYNTKGLTELINYLKENRLDKFFQVDTKYKYFMTLNPVPYSKTNFETGEMQINDYSAALHEAVHAMGIKTHKNLWLSEGICEYLGKGLSFQKQIDASYIQILTAAEKGTLPNNNQKALLYQKTAEFYQAMGGVYSSLESFDVKLFMKAFAKAEIETNIFQTIGEVYRAEYKNEYTLPGSDLSYTQAACVVGYLVDEFGLETVLTAYQTQDLEGTFGMDADAIVKAWRSRL